MNVCLLGESSTVTISFLLSALVPDTQSGCYRLSEIFKTLCPTKLDSPTFFPGSDTNPPKAQQLTLASRIILCRDKDQRALCYSQFLT